VDRPWKPAGRRAAETGLRLVPLSCTGGGRKADRSPGCLGAGWSRMETGDHVGKTIVVRDSSIGPPTSELVSVSGGTKVGQCWRFENPPSWVGFSSCASTQNPSSFFVSTAFVALPCGPSLRLHGSAKPSRPPTRAEGKTRSFAPPSRESQTGGFPPFSHRRSQSGKEHGGDLQSAGRPFHLHPESLMAALIAANIGTARSQTPTRSGPHGLGWRWFRRGGGTGGS